MQYDLKEMEKEYGGKSDSECVSLIKQFYSEMTERGEKLVGLLWYFEKTKRFRNVDGYKHAPFSDFVWEVCKIPYNRYRELAYAYNWYPVESKEYGPQVIQAIRAKVGVVKVPQVLKEIKTKVAEIKDPGKRRETIYKIVEKHAPKVPPKVPLAEDSKAYWKDKYDQLLTKYKALERENEKLKAQLQKQKAPVKAFLAMKEAVMPMMQA